MTQFKHDLLALYDRSRPLGLIGGFAFGIGGCTSEQATQIGERPGPPPGEMAAMRSYPDVTARAADGSTCGAYPQRRHRAGFACAPAS